MIAPASDLHELLACSSPFDALTYWLLPCTPPCSMNSTLHVFGFVYLTLLAIELLVKGSEAESSGEGMFCSSVV